MPTNRLAVLALLLVACRGPELQVASAGDSTHVATQRRRLDAIAVDLAQYCGPASSNSSADARGKPDNPGNKPPPPDTVWIPSPPDTVIIVDTVIVRDSAVVIVDTVVVTPPPAAWLCDDRAMLDSARAAEVYVAIPPVDTTTPPPVITGIAINPGESIQAKVDANPGATTFILKAGRHVRQDVRPKSGNVFRGEGRTVTILDGENVATRAFRGHNGGSWVNDVKLVNFQITRYNAPAQSGPVWGGDDMAASTERWVLDSMYIHHNTNLGVRIGHHMKVLRSDVSYNSTINIGGAGRGVLVDGSSFNFGNQGCPNDPGFESGGSKFAVTDSLIVRNSAFKSSCGVGLWLDIANVNYLLENNTVEDNIREGICIEISYGGIVRNNQVRRNGIGEDPYRANGWLWDAGIGIHASPDVEVYGNTLENNLHGIVAIQQNRGSGPRGPYIVQNLYVHDNVITQQQGFHPAGAAQDVGDNAIFTSRNNRWDRNTYHRGGSTTGFAWMNNEYRTWAQWQGYGQDPAGTYKP